MPRIKSAVSEVSDADEGISERDLELTKLQNRYRLMLSDRQNYAEESQTVIRRQRAEISSLEKERDEILKEMRLIDSKSNQNKDGENCEKLVILADTKDNLSMRIDEEKARHVELDSKIRECERKIRKHVTKVGGSCVGRQHTIQMTKRIRTLENRLDNTVKKYNHVLTQNGTLRDEIDGLRIERNRFDNLYKKLDKHLSQLRREIVELIETSTQAFEQREESQTKIVQMKERADKDLSQHNAEMKELIRVIDHDRRLKQFMNMKVSERLEDEQLTTWKLKKFNEAESRRAAAEDSVETYQSAFARMEKLTGERNLDKLVDYFIEKEDRNYALFNFVLEQNSTIGRCTEEIQDLRDGILQITDHSNALNLQRKEIIADLDEQRQAAASVADRCIERLTIVNKILDQLAGGIDSLFKRIACDRTRLEGRLGGDADVVNQTNMIQHLGLIEQRTNELLMAQNYVNSRTTGDGGPTFDQRSCATLILLGEGPGPPAQIIPLMPPSLDDDFESGDAEEKNEVLLPLSREAIAAKVIKTVKKREMEATKDPYLYLSSASSKTKLKAK